MTLRALSIQSDVLGHKTYNSLLRQEFAQFDDIALTSYWFREGRSLPSKVVNRLASLRVPALGHNRDYRRFRVEWSQSRMARLLVEQKLREATFDLLHFHTQAHALGSTRLMERIPTVVSADMTSHQTAREITTRYPRTLMPSIRAERRTLEAAAHVVTWSEWARRSAIEDHGLPEDKVTAILPGVRLEMLREPNFAPRAKPRILFMGRDFKRKGGDDLLEVFCSGLANEATLDIATDQDVPTNLPGVTVHHRVEAYSERWHELFQNADIFVMASYAEAFGLVFQEAGAYGLVLIGSEVGGIPEMVRHGENGFLVTPGDREALKQHLLALLHDPAQRAAMRRRSYEIALERFDAHKNFRRLADTFLAAAGR